MLERPILQHPGDAEKRGDEHGVEHQGVYQEVRRRRPKAPRRRRDEALQQPVESVERRPRDQYAVDSHREKPAGVLRDRRSFDRESDPKMVQVVASNSRVL